MTCARVFKHLLSSFEHQNVFGSAFIFTELVSKVNKSPCGFRFTCGVPLAFFFVLRYVCGISCNSRTSKEKTRQIKFDLCEQDVATTGACSAACMESLTSQK